VHQAKLNSQDDKKQTKTPHFCASKDTIKKMKAQSKEWKKYLKI
jgi:hypothetical protein